MKHVHNFDDWILNEGLGSLMKSFFGKLSNDISRPVKDGIVKIQKAIDTKTGEIKTKDLLSQIDASLDSISKSTQEKLDKAEEEKDFKSAMKNFLSNLKALFVAANIPLEGLVKDPNKFDMGSWSKNENFSIEGTSINEKFFIGDMEKSFVDLIKVEDPAKFETALDEFVDDWTQSYGREYAWDKEANMEKVKKSFVDFSTTLLDSFKKKLAKLSAEDLTKVVTAGSKKPESDKGIDLKAAKEVETSDGKKQFLKALEELTGEETMLKIPGKTQGTYDIVIKGVKIK